MATNRPRQPLAVTLVPMLDGLVVGIAGWLAYYTRWDRWNMPLDYLSVLVLGIGLVLVLFPVTGAYRSWRGDIHWRDTGNALPGLFTVTVLLMIVGTLTKTSADFSRLWMGYWFIYALCALFAYRWLGALLWSRLSPRQRPTLRILIVGEGRFARSVAEKARGAQDANWEIVGLVSPDLDAGADAPLAGDMPGMTLEAMEAMVSDPEADLDEVWIAMENNALDQHKVVIDMLQSTCLTVRYVPDLSMLALLNHMPSQVAGMMVIDLNASPLQGPSSLIKTALDKLIASAALLILAPAFVVIAVLIKRDSTGPVFFRQERHGWDGKVIQVLKFRTMREPGPGEDGGGQARRDDPRVTGIGGFLRRTSLDELPQFINVLKGDMSVVGPRPHPLALNKNYVRRIDAYMQRHRVKPGITGWAQIHGLRGETETLDKMQRRVEYDLYYIEHWSLWLDIKIIALTLVGGWTGANAY